MHVLIVTNYFAPEGGAAAVRLTRLARQLHQRGHQVTVLTSLPHYPQGEVYQDYRGRLTVSTDLDGIRVVQTWLLATPSPRISRKAISQLTFMLSASLQGLRLPKPDVILIEGQPIFAGLAGLFLATLKRRPYVLNVSDLWPDHLLSVGALTETHPVYRLARRVTDTMYRRASSIVAMSPRWAETIQSRLHAPKKIHIILNGIDLDQFHFQIDNTKFKQKYGINSKKTVSFIGTFSTQYDFETMFRAITILSKDHDIQPIIIGRGSQENAVRNHLKQHDQLIWIPWIQHDEIPQAWNASHATYWAMRDHPLYCGTIPAKLYEAMACGVPIMAAMEGAGAQILEESRAGAAVPCGDVSGLVRVLGDVLERDGLRMQYSEAARRYAETHFDANRVVAAYEQALLSAVAERV